LLRMLYFPMMFPRFSHIQVESTAVSRSPCCALGAQLLKRLLVGSSLSTHRIEDPLVALPSYSGEFVACNPYVWLCMHICIYIYMSMDIDIDIDKYIYM
jgi:hypothetical protein